MNKPMRVKRLPTMITLAIFGMRGMHGLARHEALMNHLLEQQVER